jgi:hypothetical protein
MSRRREVVGVQNRVRRRAVRALAVVVVVAGATMTGATAAVAAGSITVTPSAGLVDGQTVTVTGSGWEPGEAVYYCEAVAIDPPGADDCGTVIKNVTADGTGNFSIPVVMERIIAPLRLGRQPVDCAAPVQTCVFAAARLDLSGLVLVNLGFAPAPPLVLPSATSVPEGNSGTANLDMPVALSYASSSTVTAQWATNSDPGAPVGQADPATDFTPASGTVTFAPGDTAETVTISVNGDPLVEPDESIVVSFSQPTNATVGAFNFPVIVNDDHAIVLPGGVAVAEGNSATTNLLLPLTLSNPSAQTITVQWRTASQSGPPPHADPATDFTVASGVVTFAPGETEKAVTISVNGDTLVEPDEWIVVGFNHPTNAQMGGFWGLGFAVILNDD